MKVIYITLIILSVLFSVHIFTKDTITSFEFYSLCFLVLGAAITGIAASHHQKTKAH